jgi:hypothetical protein
MLKTCFCSLLITALVLLSSACEVQKRRYQKGFFVATKHGSEFASKKRDYHLTLNQTSVPVLGSEPLVSNAIAKEKPRTADFHNNQPAADSCDVLIYKNGREESAIILEISLSEVRYKRCDNREGPTYVTKKSDLFLIKYRNGTREVIRSEPEIQNKPVPSSAMSASQRKNRQLHPAAVPSLISAILGFVIPYIALLVTFTVFSSTFTPYMIVIMVFASLLAVILGITADKKIREQPEVYKGRGIAMPGYIMGIVQLCIWAIVGFFALISFI